MTRPILAEDLFSIIGDLIRRVEILERAPRLPAASIKEGALTILDAAGVVRVKVGQDGADYGVKVYDAAGANPVSLETLAFGVSAAVVATSEGTSSSAYTDLATVGPAVSVTIGVSGRALVLHGAEPGLSDLDSPFVSYAISGATTRAASDAWNVGAYISTPGIGMRAGVARASIQTGLTPGVNTFTLKYRDVGGQSVTFTNRWIVVQPF
jgi:hypothetical protein